MRKLRPISTSFQVQLGLEELQYDDSECVVIGILRRSPASKAHLIFVLAGRNACNLAAETLFRLQSFPNLASF